MTFDQSLIVASVLAVTMLVGCTDLPGEPTWRSHESPLVTAHRGSRMEYDDNAAEGFTDCLNAGIRGFETDIRITKDDELVIMHDIDVTRTTTGKGNIHDMTVNEVTNLVLKKCGKHVPTARQVMETLRGHRDIRIEFEMKESAKALGTARAELYCRKLHALAAEIMEPGTYTFTSFDFGLLTTMKQLYPNAPIGAIVGQPLTREFVDRAVSIGCCAVAPLLKGTTREVVDYARSKDMVVTLWMVQNDNDYEKARELGATCTTSDFAKRVHTYATRQKQHPTTSESVVRLDHANGQAVGADMTERLQKLFDDDATREVVLGKGDWITRPLFIRRSDLTLRLENGARLVAKRGEYHGRNDEMISITNGIRNISILGEGNAELYMHIRDYQDTSKYSFSEWRHAIRIWKAENVTVRGITVRGSGGDGIEVNGGRKVLVENCKCFDCNRLGIGTVTARDMTVRKCYFEGNDGTPPCCGGDFEPNYANEPLVNILIEDCDFVNHKRAGGLLFHLSPLTPKSEPVSIVVRNCRSIGNRSFGYRVTAAGARGPVKGTFRFENCISKDNQGCDVELDGLSDDGIKFEFIGCNFTKFRKSKYEKVAGVLPFLPREVKPLDTAVKTRKSGYLRRSGEFVQHVPAAGKYKVHFDMIPSDPPRVPSAEVSVCDHAGTPLGVTKLTGNGGDIEVESRGENCYTFSVHMDNALVSMVSEIPGAGIRMDKTPHIYTGRKHQYLFKVPAKQESVTVTIIGEEPCTAQLLNAAGKVVAQGSSPRGAKNLTATRKPSENDEVWTLDFTKVVEDAYFMLPEPLFPYAEIK